MMIDHEGQRERMYSRYNRQFSCCRNGLRMALYQKSRWWNVCSNFDAGQFSKCHPPCPKSNISIDEYEAKGMARFSMLDTNGDGSITLAELRAITKAAKQGKANTAG